MDVFAEAFYLLPYMLFLFWPGLIISQSINKKKLSHKNLLIAFCISWAVSSVPQLFFGKGIYNHLSAFIIVPVSSFLVAHVMTGKDKVLQIDQFVLLKNKSSNEIKRIKIGFCWPCFLFSFFFGLPLFQRGLNVWGGLMTGTSFLYIILNSSDSVKQRESAFIILLAIIGLSIYLGFKCNELTAKNLLEKGWQIEEDENSNLALAKERWSLG